MAPGAARDPGIAALGTWSGGRFMHFGEPLEEARLEALLRPDAAIDTVITADVYGAGEADRLLGRALEGVPREQVCVVGAVGHDFYTGERAGAKGFPRFTDPSLRRADDYAGYLRMATERSLERCGIDRFDLLLLHNPDRIGYGSEAVWEGMAALRDAGLTRVLGVAPGPANGFTLDAIGCFERFGGLIDWAMLILNPLEPWPGELALGAAAAAGVAVIARVVDYGGIFHDDVIAGHAFAPGDHRSFRPAGWVEEGRERIERMRPIAERNGLTMLQLACAWDLAHEPVACVAPTLIQESGDGARPIEDKRADLAALPRERRLDDAEVAFIRELGDNTGCMALKGAAPDHEGADLPDRWSLGDEHLAVAARWRIDPARDLVATWAAAPLTWRRRASARSRRARLVAGGPQRRHDRIGMLGAARLERQLDAGLAHLQVDGLADVLDGEKIRARLRDRRQQRRQRPGTVGDDGEHPQAPADRGLVAAREQRQQSGVDVATGEHDDRRAGGCRPREACGQRGDADRAGAFDDELRALHEQHHRLGGVLLADDDHIVDPARDERQREPSGALDRDAVRDRRGRVDRERRAGGKGCREGRTRRDLYADDLDRGTGELDRPGEAGGEAASPDRHDHLRHVGHLFEDLEAERRLADDHVRIVEGMDEHRAGLDRPRARRGDAVVDALAAERDHPAVALHCRHLRDRRLGRHEHLA